LYVRAARVHTKVAAAAAALQAFILTQRMAHSHSHHHASVSRKLSIATAANVMVVAAEIGIGIYAGSLALVGDALHNLTDVAALVIALVAVRLERKTPTREKSFGYQRAGILAAFVNSGLLLAFTLFLFRESWSRLQHPQEVQTSAMLIMAVIALLVNAATALSIHHESREDVNVRGAFVHMIGDAVSSAGIIVAALLIRFTGTTMWDALVTMFIALLILWSSYGVLCCSKERRPASIPPRSRVRWEASTEFTACITCTSGRLDRRARRCRVTSWLATYR
jgi:cobalt-zinc-cadmium efflux system protein